MTSSMNSSSFKGITQGLREAIELEKSIPGAAKLHRPQDIDMA